MEATDARCEADELVARFNVMLGPGQNPLANGSWALALTQDAGELRPLRVQPARDLDLNALTRQFKYPRGSYRVVPWVEPAGVLRLEVRNRRSRSRARTRPSLVARLKPKFVRNLKLRRRAFFAVYRLFRAMAKRDQTARILFTSDSHTELTGNLAVIYDRMVERGLAGTYRLEKIFKASVSVRRGWRDRWRLPRLLAQADVILLDDYQPVIYTLPPDPARRIIQLWHASGALKTVGYSRVGKPGGPTPFARRHKNYTYAIVSGTHDVPYYAEAFGLPEERVVPTGIPRMDRYFDPGHAEASRAATSREFPEISGRMAILFAPTFRGPGPRRAYYDYDQVDWDALHAVCDEKDAVVIFKMHPFVRGEPPIPAHVGDRIVDASRSRIDVNDLLFSMDLLITDYSSIVFEFSTQLRPMLFFAYDLEEYVATRDFYVPLEDFAPGRIVRTFPELVDAIRTGTYDAERVAEFRRQHFAHLDGGATDRVIDQLILGPADQPSRGWRRVGAGRPTGEA